MREAREQALQQHRDWKLQIELCDLVAADEWKILWPDGTVEHSQPLVDNVYVESLEDKMGAAGATLPRLTVHPARGTRKDRAESSASQRRRVLLSYWERSRLKREVKSYYHDWLHTGSPFAMPWCNWKRLDGSATAPDERFPFYMQLDPRTVFPLAHNSQKDLTHVMVMRQKRVRDFEADWGRDHPALAVLRVERQVRFGNDSKALWLEEVWYMDGDTWAVGVADSMLPPQQQGSAWVAGGRVHDSQTGGPIIHWLKEPEKHRLIGCPVVEARRANAGRPGYRGALLDVLPALRTAQNIMARLLDDLEMSVYAPTVLDNIENRHEFGLGATLYGDGQGPARITRDRPPVNFEGQQVVKDTIERARRQAFQPPQRGGEAGASIVSAKGTMALMGSFNNELAWMQNDLEEMIGRLGQLTACFDEKWCWGKKQIDGFDYQGTPYVETYDARVTFRGDYRHHVSYGERSGLDEQNHMIRIATVRELGGMSLREFIEKAGVSEDALATERDMAIEELVDQYLKVLIPQQIQSGDLTAIASFIARIDDDKKTVREAVLEAIAEQTQVQPDQGAGGAGGPGSGRADIMRLARSLDQGGIPGGAEGQPPSQLPGSAPGGPAVDRQLAAVGPGSG